MKKTTKIIISAASSLVLIAAIVTASLFMNRDKLGLEPESTGNAPAVTQSTTVTESFWDFNAYLSQIAGESGTATSGVVTDVNGSIIDPSQNVTVTDSAGNVITVPSTSSPLIPNTSIVYVYPSDTYVQPTTEKVTQKPVTTTDNSPEMIEFKYKLDTSNKTVALVKYIGSDTVPTIPKTIGGYTVTSIGDSCFKGKSITSVYIPEKIESIGSNAFNGCTKLTAVFCMGSGSLTVGDSAFSGCTSLRTVGLSAKTKSIGTNAFLNCKAIKSIRISATVTTIASNAFSGHADNFEIICPAGSAAEEYAKTYNINYSNSY